jgi:hypothetical protein
VFVGFTYVLHHPWFVCTEPDGNGRVVVVSATDLNRCFDKTCILRPGDHPMITKDSAIYYDLADFMLIDTIKKMAEHKTLKPREPAADELMVRIRRGALDSGHTPNDVMIAVSRCPWKPKETATESS